MQRESEERLQKEAEQEVEELRRKEQEDKDRESMEQDNSHNNLAYPPSTLGDTITGGHLPLA